MDPADDRRYLRATDLEVAMRRGRVVEQFLGPFCTFDTPQIRWLELRPREDGSVCLTVYERVDDGSPLFLDVYAFSELSPDGEPPQVVFDTLSMALDHTVAQFGANAEKWVNEGVVQDEYESYVRNRDS